MSVERDDQVWSKCLQIAKDRVQVLSDMEGECTSPVLRGMLVVGMTVLPLLSNRDEGNMNCRIVMPC